MKAALGLIIKLTEVVMILSTLFCYHYATSLDQIDSQNLIHGTLVGYTIILIVFILAEISNAKVDYTLTILLTFLGFGLLIATGMILIDKGIKSISSTDDYMTAAAGSLGIINGLLFLLDSIMISNRKTGNNKDKEAQKSKSKS